MHELCLRNLIVTSVILILVLLLLFYDTFYAIYNIWMTIGTYNHGILMVPTAIWLIWRRREFLNRIHIHPSYYAVLASIPVIIFWSVSSSQKFNYGMQLAVFLLIFCIIWGVWGGEFVKENMFALVFLLLSVPVGDFLVPVLQDFTATVVVYMLKISGIPVYRESLYFYVPTGAFEVAKACSGIRYLIASVIIGILYAYLRFVSIGKRLIVVAISILIPLVANGVRAYLIVLIAHLTDMKYATGFDHIIYGWVFFGFVVFLLFYIGSYFEEDKQPEDDNGNVGKGGCVWGRKTITVSVLFTSIFLTHYVFLKYTFPVD